MIKLREYQIKMLNDAISSLNRSSNPFVVSPTGSGKMIVIAALAKHLKLPVLVVEHRIELVKQAIEKLKFAGEKPGKIVSGLPDPFPNALIKVGMIQTMSRRLSFGGGNGNAIKSGGAHYSPQIIIIDEAHLAAAKSYKSLIAAFPRARIVCFSATPWRLDGIGFTEICDELILGPSITELVGLRHLVSTEYHAYDQLDLRSVSLPDNNTEYDQDKVAVMMESITENIVDEWMANFRNRTTVAFTSNIRQSKKLADAFRRRGVAAEHVDGSTPDGVRTSAIERLRSGVTRIICNCGIFVEGFDAPIISCVILALATKSLSKFLQCCGRGMRPDLESGKRNLIVMDFGENHKNHGTPEEDREWSINDRRIARPTKEHVEIIEDSMDYTESMMIADININNQQNQHVRTNVYQPNAHDYGIDRNSSIEENDEWRRRYSQAGKPQRDKQVRLAANGASAAIVGRAPPQWLPVGWYGYWQSLEAYRVFHRLPDSYSEKTVRIELAKATGAL